MSKLAKILGPSYVPSGSDQPSVTSTVQSQSAVLTCKCDESTQTYSNSFFDPFNPLNNLTINNKRQIEPLAHQRSSPFSIELIQSLSTQDYSVYSTNGIKRDFFGYTLNSHEHENQTHLNNALKNSEDYYINKVWRFRNNSEQRLQGLNISPTPQLKNDYDEMEIAIHKQNLLPTIEPGAEVDVCVTLRVPRQPGLFKRKFRVNDHFGGQVSISNHDSNELEVIFSVVPDEVNSPVFGNIYVGDPLKGLDTTHYTQEKTYYFCNWGVYYFDRIGNYKEGRYTKVTSHQKYDRFAWDINAKKDFEKGKNVYAIDDGKVVRIDKNYGAIWIQHGFVEGKEETTGYIAAYIHMSQTSWSKTSNSFYAWSVGSRISKHQLLGIIGGRYKASESALPPHLHFSIAPIKHFDNSNVHQLNTVHANIKPLTEDMLSGLDYSKLSVTITKNLPNTGEIPLSGANVKIVNTKHSRITDQQGLALFERLGSNHYEILIEHNDYHSQTLQLEFDYKQHQNTTIRMKPKQAWDISLIPNIMDENKWDTGAALMRYWFEHKPPHSPSAVIEATNDSIVTMEWLLTFSPAKRMYNKLASPQTYRKKITKDELVKQLQTNYMFKKAKHAKLELKVCTDKFSIPFGDVSKSARVLENNYYIQSETRGPKQSNLSLTIDDLYTALGAFNLHSAVEGTIEYNPENQPNSNIYLISITKLGIYVKDSYNFIDKQRLGYWNPKTNDASRVKLHNDYKKASNEIFRQWREENGFGRDFIVYSDVKVVELEEPISWKQRIVD